MAVKKVGGKFVSSKVTFIRDSDPKVNDLPHTFVDSYTEWAASVTDAPVQYHRATGVTMLSVLLTPHIKLPTSFGTFIPNIWMMVLAGTTMTRKSTSLNLAAKLLDDVTDDWMLATDGSPEGILTELQHRDGKISVFLRDEITGFMSAVSGRDYLSGILEAFTQLYDGVPQVRVLRRERIEIKNPYFVFMGGGIKTRMEEIVSMEHIRSGFLPRFLFVTGSTTREEVRPIGPPAEEELKTDGTSPRDDILNQLWRINNYYTKSDTDEGTNQIKIKGVVKAQVPKVRQTKLTGSPEFWQRLVELNDDAMELGSRSSSPELYTPLYTRLANTIMKVAMLLAGADFSTVIEVHHLQKAISLGQEWVDTVTEFATAIEQQPDMDKWEKKADKIITWIKSVSPEPISQTKLMQHFRIRTKDIDDIKATLMARGIVLISPYPHPKSLGSGKIFYSLNPNVHGNTLSGEAPNSIQREDSYQSNGTSQGHEEGPETTINGRRVKFATPTQALREFKKQEQEDNGRWPKAD